MNRYFKQGAIRYSRFYVRGELIQKAVTVPTDYYKQFLQWAQSGNRGKEVVCCIPTLFLLTLYIYFMKQLF